MGDPANDRHKVGKWTGFGKSDLAILALTAL